jgi:uncharacterized membrane protein (DUF485 family)
MNEASEGVFAQQLEANLDARDTLQKRDYDSYKILNRKRNAHACIMSIVFIVLYPLGAISVHLPIDRIPGLRNTYLRNKISAIHAPIQILGFVMMIGGFALGIRIAHDLGYLKSPVNHHIIIGFVVVCTIIVFQPILGALQHRHFKKTGKKSILGYVHRWIGRAAILLGIINNGLGLQFAQMDIVVPTSSFIRNFVLAGILALIWLGLVAYDTFAPRPAATTTTNKSDGIAINEQKADA